MTVGEEVVGGFGDGVVEGGELFEGRDKVRIGEVVVALLEVEGAHVGGRGVRDGVGRLAEDAEGRGVGGEGLVVVVGIALEDGGEEGEELGVLAVALLLGLLWVLVVDLVRAGVRVRVRVRVCDKWGVCTRRTIP